MHKSKIAQEYLPRIELAATHTVFHFLVREPQVDCLSAPRQFDVIMATRDNTTSGMTSCPTLAVTAFFPSIRITASPRFALPEETIPARDHLCRIGYH
jgi:hypothetical protein